MAYSCSVLRAIEGATLLSLHHIKCFQTFPLLSLHQIKRFQTFPTASLFIVQSSLTSILPELLLMFHAPFFDTIRHFSASSFLPRNCNIRVIKRHPETTELMAKRQPTHGITYNELQQQCLALCEKRSYTSHYTRCNLPC